MAMLEMEMNQTEEIDELIDFYRMIIEQMEGQEDCPSELNFRLYLELYRILGKDNGYERQMIAEKFFERDSDFKQVLHD